MDRPLHPMADVLRLVREGGFGRHGRARPHAHKVPRAAAPHVPPADGTTRVTWVGHASSVVQAGGRTFLLDPVWSTWLPGGIRRVTAPGVPLADLPPIDGVLISHDHFDHMDAPTLRAIGRHVPVYVPLGAGKWFLRRGWSQVTELDWWEDVVLPQGRPEGPPGKGPAGAEEGAPGSRDGAGQGEVRLTFVPAHHWCRRSPRDTNDRLWGGWVVTDPHGRGVHFAGDTAYGDHFTEIGRRMDIGTTLLPVGSYAPRWFMQDVHMGPEEAVQVVQDLGAQRMVPVHWGTFALTREPLMEPIERCRQAWRDAGRRPEDLWDLALGETRALPEA